MSIDRGARGAGLLWTIRILCILCIVILLLFLFGEGDISKPLNLTTAEGVGLLFFPVGVVAGMIVGWWREGLGGAITVASLALFYSVDWVASGTPPSGPFFLLFSLPGILFGIYGWVYRRKA